jgi:hypothetical protein
MAFDAHTNLAISTVATAPSPPTTGTSLVVSAGTGGRFGAVPFNATIWPSNAVPTPLNAEIVRVTARTADTLTITRAQEGTTARAIGFGDQIAATVTVKTLTDLETQAAIKDQANTFAASQTISADYGSWRLNQPTAPADGRLWSLVGTGIDVQFQPLADSGSAQPSALIVQRAGGVVVRTSLTEQQRATPLGYWINIPNNPGNFGATGGAVSVATYLNQAYTLIGRTMIYTFYLQMTVTGAPTEIHHALPAGFTPKTYIGAPFTHGASTGFMTTIAGNSVIRLRMDSVGTAPFPAVTEYMIGTLAFELT